MCHMKATSLNYSHTCTEARITARQGRSVWKFHKACFRMVRCDMHCMDMHGHLDNHVGILTGLYVLYIIHNNKPHSMTPNTFFIHEQKYSLKHPYPYPLPLLLFHCIWLKPTCIVKLCILGTVI